MQKTDFLVEKQIFGDQFHAPAAQFFSAVGSGSVMQNDKFIMSSKPTNLESNQKKQYVRIFVFKN